MARRDGRLADVDVTGVLDLVVGGGALRPAPLLGNRNVTRRRERPPEIFPVSLLGSRDATRRRERPRQIIVIARRAGGRAFLHPVPRLFQLKAVMRACAKRSSAMAAGASASLHIPASLQFLRPADSGYAGATRRRFGVRRIARRSVDLRALRAQFRPRDGRRTGSRPALRVSMPLAPIKVRSSMIWRPGHCKRGSRFRPRVDAWTMDAARRCRRASSAATHGRASSHCRCGGPVGGDEGAGGRRGAGAGTGGATTAGAPGAGRRGVAVVCVLEKGGVVPQNRPLDTGPQLLKRTTRSTTRRRHGGCPA